MPSSPDARLDEDLYCIECGYNLRGLSGDPRRCPECGYDNPLNELIIPARIIRRQMIRLESAPTFAFAATLMLALGGLLLILGSTPCAIVLFAVGAILLPATIQQFGRNSRWRPGWVGVLGSFYLAGVGMFAPIPAGVLAAILFSANLPPVLVAPGVILLLFLSVAWPLYARAKRQLAELQRVTAVELAKEELGDRTRRPT